MRCSDACMCADPQTVVQRQHNISSVDPTTYAARFLDFMSGVFL